MDGGGLAGGVFHQLPPSTHANSTNICPIKKVVRCQISYSMGFDSDRCPIVIWRSRYYAAAVFVIVVR